MRVALVILSLMLAATSAQTLQTVTGEGLADIQNQLVEPARQLALAGAHWDAVTKALGIAIKADTLVMDSAVAEHIIQTQVQGAVRSSKIVSEERKGDLYRVTVEDVIEPVAAQEKAADLIRNTSIVVVIPASFRTTNQPQNKVSESLIQRLVDRGNNVVDETVAAQNLTPAQLEAVLAGSSVALRSAGVKFLSNLALFGRIEGTALTQPGDDIPFVGKANFFIVRASLAYRILALAGSGANAGRIIASGSITANGMGNSAEAAFDNAVQALSNPALDDVIPKFERYFDGNRQSVEIRLGGAVDLAAHARVKETLSQVQWLSNIQDKGLGQFQADSTEKPIYLAYSLDRKPGLKVENFTERLIQLALR